jgi:hypothetical protein
MNKKFVTRLLTVLAVSTVFAGQLPEAYAQQPGTVESVGQTSRGFALGAGIATMPFVLDDDLLNLSTFSASIGLGYKIDRFIIGATFDFSRFGSTNQVDDGTGNTITLDQSAYSFLLGPEFQAALLRSADRRAELVGVAALMIGTVGNDSSVSGQPDPPPSPDAPTDILLRWRLAPGVRYWMHPNIAFNALVGISGFHQIRDGNGASSDRSASMTTMYTQFGLLGVF